MARDFSIARRSTARNAQFCYHEETMRRFAFAVILAFTLAAASPAMAAPASGSLVSSFGRNFTTGARYYVQTVEGWMHALLSFLGLESRFAVVDENDACTQESRCSEGLVCLNVCEGNACERFEKRCVRGPATVLVLGTASICNGDNLCVDGTDCVRVCPRGATCTATHRCLKTSSSLRSCTTDTECKAVCATLSMPPIGPSAYVARCASDGCACDPIEIDPNAKRIACPGTERPPLVCSSGTTQACAVSSDGGAPLETCVAAPEYGGTCFDSGECANAACPEGSQPFCSDDQRCKCRTSETQVVACQSASECSAAGCASNEIPACISGACACAPAGATTACKTVSECSNDCPQGFSAACENERCLCQRTIENVPVSCQSVSDCGPVACPANYEKACLNAVCACTHTEQPQ